MSGFGSQLAEKILQDAKHTARDLSDIAPDEYLEQHKIFPAAENYTLWDREARSEVSSNEDVEARAGLLVRAVRDYERQHVFGSLASDAIPDPEIIEMRGKSLTDEQRNETRSIPFEIASEVQRGVLRHTHFNAELHSEHLPGQTLEQNLGTLDESEDDPFDLNCLLQLIRSWRPHEAFSGKTKSRLSRHGTKSVRSNLTYEIPSVVTGGRGQQVLNALGDTCAMNNFMSPGCAAKLGLEVDTAIRKLVTVGSGARVRTSGAVKALFHFRDELDGGHSEWFHILPNAVQELVLGKPFLDLTRTFKDKAKRLSRVKERIMSTLSQHRLCYLGVGAPRFTGLLNGRPMEALADTGSNVLIMDEDYANRLGIPTLRGSEYMDRLLFADGTTKMTSGIAHGVQWQFGLSGGHPDHYLDFHILKNAPAQVILNDSFIFDTDAFDEYECYLVDDEAEPEYEDHDTYFFHIGYDLSYDAQGKVDNTSIAHLNYQEQQRRNLVEDELENLRGQHYADAWAKEQELRSRFGVAIQALLDAPPVVKPAAMASVVVGAGLVVTGSSSAADSTDNIALDLQESPHTPQSCKRKWLRLKLKRKKQSKAFPQRV